MRKSTFIGNLVAWVAVAAACVAFLAWYHLTDFEVVAAAIGDSALVQLGVVAASPLLLYAMGALIGLALVWFKNIEFGRGFKVLWRVVGIVGLAIIAMSVAPLLSPALETTFMWASVIVVYVSLAAPILIMMFGFSYALGCAGVDRDKRGPFAKYLPDDHFE